MVAPTGTSPRLIFSTLELSVAHSVILISLRYLCAKIALFTDTPKAFPDFFHSNGKIFFVA